MAAEKNNSKPRSITLEDIRQMMQAEVQRALQEELKPLTEKIDSLVVQIGTASTETTRALEQFGNALKADIAKDIQKRLTGIVATPQAGKTEEEDNTPFIALEDKAITLPDGKTALIVRGSRIAAKNAAQFKDKVKMRRAYGHEV